jgi:hypothetical protein
MHCCPAVLAPHEFLACLHAEELTVSLAVKGRSFFLVASAHADDERIRDPTLAILAEAHQKSLDTNTIWWVITIFR